MEHEQFTIHVAALIYNENDQLLTARRSDKVSNSPGLYSYPGGRVEYQVDANNMYDESLMNIIEENLVREINEEVKTKIDNLQYLHSHAYTKASGEKTVVLVFTAKQIGANPEPDLKEITEVKWITEEDLKDLNTLPVISTVYKMGFDHLKKDNYHQFIEVAGIVLNEKNEVLVLREISTGKYIFPHGSVENLPGRTWEILEKNLMRNIYKQTAIEIDEGMIPFTDREFLGKDGFEKIIQFFICKYNRGETMITDPDQFSEVKWLSKNKLVESDFRPLVYAVFIKAFEFISKINN